MSASDTIVHGVADVSRSALLQVRSLGKRYGDQHVGEARGGNHQPVSPL